MKRYLVSGLCFAMICLFASPGEIQTARVAPIRVITQRPIGTSRMGNTPTFTAGLNGVGNYKLQGVVVYLSLVPLMPGHKLVLELDDRQTPGALSGDQLPPGQGHSHNQILALIRADNFGVVLTVVDPGEERPVTGDLPPLDIQLKTTFDSSRIISVAAGEPVLFFAALALAHWTRIRSRRPEEATHA
jgi:hypothetical protein